MKEFRVFVIKKKFELKEKMGKKHYQLKLKIIKKKHWLLKPMQKWILLIK